MAVLVLILWPFLLGVLWLQWPLNMLAILLPLSLIVWKSRPLGLVSGPNFWIKTSKATPCFSATYKSNGFLRFGIPSDRAVVIKYLIFLKACCCVSAHASGSVSAF